MLNHRPEWCPHKECIFLLQFSDAMCVGRLKEPITHDEVENTHRFCLDERETQHGVHDLSLNKGDAWLMQILLEKIQKS